MTPLFAQTQEAAPASTPKPAPGLFDSPLPLMIGGLLLFWLIVLLPADRRRRKDAEKLVAELKPGKRVVTSGGIVGVVVTAKDGDEELTVRSADAKLKVLRSSVTRVLGDETPASDAK